MEIKLSISLRADSTDPFSDRFSSCNLSEKKSVESARRLLDICTYKKVRCIETITWFDCVDAVVLDLK